MRIQRRIKRYFTALPIDADKDKMLDFYNPNPTCNKSTEKCFLMPAVVSCLCLALALICFSSFCIYVEAQEYRESVMFFEKYDLSMEGLSRSEIKKVYKDISTGNFAYDKTIEIMNTISMEVNNVELNDIDSDALKALWHKKYAQINAQENKSGTKYLFNGTCFQKYENGRLAWETDIQTEIDCCYILLDEGILVAGNTGTNMLRMVLMDNYGNIRWEYLSENVMRSPSLAFSEGIIHAMGHNYQAGGTELNILCLDLNGNFVSEKKNIFDGYINIQGLAVNGEHYVVKASRNGNKEMLGLSFEGEILDKTVFKLDGKDCIIKDILCHDGKLYVSALFLNRPTDTFYSAKFSPLYEEYQAAYEAKGFGPGNENYDFDMGEEYNVRLTGIFKEQYTASLLILDGSDSVSSVYTVEGGYCGSLSHSEQGQMLWQIFRIDNAKPALPIVSFCSAYMYSTEFSLYFSDGTFFNKSEVGNEVVGDVSLFQ